MEFPAERSVSKNPISIERGLRKLEFVRSPTAKARNACTHVIVEFARSVPLDTGEVVQVPLGVRLGTARMLNGVPTLLTPPDGNGLEDYLYRLEGDL
jgi:hypothetical protein